MFGYLLKPLLITLLVILAVIGIGGGTAYIIYNNLNNNVDAAQERGYEEGYAQGYETGFNMGSETGYQEGSKAALMEAGGIDTNLVNPDTYYFLYNPTYEEMRAALDDIGMNPANTILNYAKENGIRAAYVRVPIAREAGPGRIFLFHLVGFETVDRGFIIVEPHSHREVKVKVGRSYSGLNGFPISNYDDTITKVTVVW